MALPTTHPLVAPLSLQPLNAANFNVVEYLNEQTPINELEHGDHFA